jgi:hypothetical protein
LLLFIYLFLSAFAVVFIHNKVNLNNFLSFFFKEKTNFQTFKKEIVMTLQYNFPFKTAILLGAFAAEWLLSLTSCPSRL